MVATSLLGLYIGDVGEDFYDDPQFDLGEFAAGSNKASTVVTPRSHMTKRR